MPKNLRLLRTESVRRSLYHMRLLLLLLRLRFTRVNLLPLFYALMLCRSGFAGAQAPLRLTETAGPMQKPPFSPSSQLDLRSTLEAPAGKRGFLSVGADGRFAWADGKRARFWGINISSTRLLLSPAEIEKTVDLFARAGLNMVRIEAIDNRNCLLGDTNAVDSRHFDARYFDCLDRWTDSLRRHGIYYYLDLLDFRTFKEGDGVLNADRLDRGARPYALFDKYLIQLQKEYAYRLLTHRNPYSGLRIVDDPAFALVEICNEHGFFLYVDRLDSLVEPYRTDLKNRWNEWLLAKYGTWEKLAAAWGDVNGEPAIHTDEDPASRTVELPKLATSSTAADATTVDLRLAPRRIREGVQFLSELQAAYFRDMRAYLREIGVQIPITSVVSSDIIPDVASAARESDFVAENWYGESGDEDARTPGYRYFNNRNTLRDENAVGFAPFTSGLRWNNKPVVIREWDTSWPDPYRAASVPEVLAYASLQDYDAVLLFGYQTNRAPNGSLPDALNEFAVQADPATWGLIAMAGQAYLHRAIRPAANQATIVYTADRRNQWPNRLTDLHRVAWTSRVTSILSETGWGDLSVLSSGAGKDIGSLHELLVRLGKRSPGVTPDAIQSGVWKSDTGQIVRRAHEGRLEISTPTLVSVAGELNPNVTYSVGPVRFRTASPFGALMILSLDGLPLDRSKHFLAKMVTRAENTGQVIDNAPDGFPGKFVLKARGAAPVLTFGRPSSQPTELWVLPAAPKTAAHRPAARSQLASRGKAAPLAGRGKAAAVAGRSAPASARPSASLPAPLLSLDLVDGFWEFEVREGSTRLLCDTAGIVGQASGEAFVTTEGGVERTASAGSSASN